MKLFKIRQNGNRFCGPSVISALVGIGTKQASQIIRGINGRKLVKGTSEKDIVKALSELGVQATRIDAARLNLARWTELYSDGGETFLVVAGHHWIVVQGQYAQCGKTIELVKVKNHPNARSFVTATYRLSKTDLIANSFNETAKVVKYQRLEAVRNSVAEPLALKNYREIMAVAIKKEINVEKQTDGSVKVLPPAWLDEEDDPYLHDHVCCEWNAAVVRVKHYAEIIGECIRFDLTGVNMAALDRDWSAIQHM